MSNPGEKAQRTARHHLTQLQDAINEKAPDINWIDLPLLLSIVWREIRWSETRLYKDHGTPLDPTDNTGDHGHGRGFFQIDDRFHKKFIESGGAYYPYEAAKYVITNVFLSNYMYLEKKFTKLGEPWLIKGSIAAYNCGPGNVRKALDSNRDQWDDLSDQEKWKVIDSRTARPVCNYSQDVIGWKTWWENWLRTTDWWVRIGPE